MSYSPTSSPLFYKAVANGNREGKRRQSFGSSSMNSPLRDSVMSRLPATPSPSGSKTGSFGLNNKWLYEKSRG
jgi:nucleoporin POM34